LGIDALNILVNRFTETERGRGRGVSAQTIGLVEGARGSLASEVRSAWSSGVGDAAVDTDPMASPVELLIAFSASSRSV
jgi:hypothetical protein